MFTHLQELFDAPAPAADNTADKKTASTKGSDVYLAPEVEEPMEEAALEVTTDGVVEPPPPGGLASYAAEDFEAASLSAASSSAVRVDDDDVPKKKSKFSLFGSSRKQAADDVSDMSDGDSFGSEAPAAAVARAPGGNDTDSAASSAAAADGYVKVVGMASVPEKAPVSAYRYKPEKKKKTWLLCVAALLVIVAIAVPVAVLVPRNNARSTAAASSVADTSSPAESPAESPSATPTPTLDAALPKHCEPVYDSLDSCLSGEVTKDQADACVDCVWSFLPNNRGECPALIQQVCNILDQCDCFTCSDELEDYLDCQSECEIDCGF